jgi:hypothetical protein
MSTPIPIKIALVCAIPLIHVYIAQLFGLELYRIPPIIVTSSKYFLLSYVSWIIKAPVLDRVFKALRLDELQSISSMRMADNVHFVSIVGTYMAIVFSQKPWNDGYLLLVMLSGAFAVLGLIFINIGTFS